MDARAAALLSNKPTEDVSDILPKLDIEDAVIAGQNAPGEQHPPNVNQDRDYLPEEEVDWVVTVRFAGEPELNPQEIAKLFDQQWREQFGNLTIYGLDCETGRWTYLIAADGPKKVTRLKFSWNYVDPVAENPKIDDMHMFGQRIKEVSLKLNKFGGLHALPSLAPHHAAKRAALLANLKSKLNRTAVLILKSPNGKTFSGKKIWDVMLCLGLTWGDMDCFHWINRGVEGGDYHFSVETSTHPGYFLPEKIAADEVQVEDLVFSFSIPRSARPIEVFDAMTRAIEYCQKRMGGEIRDENGKPADISRLKKLIQETDKQLRDAKLIPGSDPVLRLF